MNATTKSPEAINYYELQATLSQAVSAQQLSQPGDRDALDPRGGYGSAPRNP